MLEAYRTCSIDWKPSPIVALATNVDDSQVAAARDDGSLEIWLVSPGSVGWHCQLTIHGNPDSRVSSLVWCCAGSRGLACGRLFSSSIDGSVSEWDLFHLKQKAVLDSIGVSIWQLAVAPSKNQHPIMDPKLQLGNGNLENGVGDDSSEDEDDSDSSELREESAPENACVALACDDGCVRLYTVSQSDILTYSKSLPRVSGRVLSVAWSADASAIYSGSSDGLIRCWDAKSCHEVYRITVGHGGVGRRSELCIWSLLSLRYGTLVSADSSGCVQFWDSKRGTLLQAHSFHKGDVNALAAAPSHNRVFSAGSDGQVILYKLSSEKAGSTDEKSLAEESKKWVYVGYVRAHTHDIRSLTVAVPISREDSSLHEHVKRIRRKKKPIDFSYRKWAHMGVPMLISAGDDAKLFAYSIQEFSKFSPHDICPAPQRLPMQLVLHSALNQKILLVQNPCWLDILCVWTKHAIAPASSSGNSGGRAGTELLARVKSKVSRRIICSTISNSGEYFAYSDNLKPSLFELKRQSGNKVAFSVNKKLLPQRLLSAHAMVFSSDSSRLIMAGNDRKIYVVDVGSSELLHTFKPCREELSQDSLSDEPPITKMFTSSDGQWLAAVNCFGDVYVYNLEVQRQHWFISRLDGASVTAGGFPPSNNNVLILTTSSNQVYAFDVEAKQLGEWSVNNTFTLPKRYQEFPGEVIGLSCPPSTSSSSVVIYSARAMCVIDFGKPGEGDNNNDLMNGLDPALRKVHNGPVNGNLKRRLKDCEVDTRLGSRKNFEFFAFRDPVLFIGHLSKNSILIMDKPWLEVIKTLEAAPIHRHIFGT